MPKTDSSFDPAEYAPVAERITLFYGQYPTGRILTRALRVSERIVLFRAAVYRAADDARPAATGWASERPGDGEINTVACVENTETSAIGRALANLGITAGRARPSREEMEKAQRARVRPRTAASSPSAPSAATDDAVLATRDDLADLEEVLIEAERLGFDEARAAEIRQLLGRGRATPPEPIARVTVVALQQRLRVWLHRRNRASSRGRPVTHPRTSGGETSDRVRE